MNVFLTGTNVPEINQETSISNTPLPATIHQSVLPLSFEKELQAQATASYRSSVQIFPETAEIEKNYSSKLSTKHTGKILS